MKKSVIGLAVLSMVFFVSCKQSAKKKNKEATKQEASEAVNKEIEMTTEKVVEITSINEEGEKLHMVFDNAKGTVFINFKDDTATLSAMKSASGIWYKNDQYELSGKGNNYTLKKDGEVVFVHKDKVVPIIASNKEGDTLRMKFNNSAGYVKAYLNGGKQIKMEVKKSASGIWFENDTYELRGKGDHYTLRKGEEIIFKN